ncbi:hypothetical protein BJ912DRAFT_931819 [Pholiota molesta]|nr:hypothetical protein BJ912DRAFT_931819 [Pholiota molesta]
MESHTEPQPTVRNAVKAYAEYQFDTDETYQQGLASILAGGTIDPTASAEVQEEMIRRTRVFYFNNHHGGGPRLRDEIRALKVETAHHGCHDENRVLTFAELKELIETGNVDKIPITRSFRKG